MYLVGVIIGSLFLPAIIFWLAYQSTRNKKKAFIIAGIAFVVILAFNCIRGIVF